MSELMFKVVIISLLVSYAVHMAIVMRSHALKIIDVRALATAKVKEAELKLERASYIVDMFDKLVEEDFDIDTVKNADVDKMIDRELAKRKHLRERVIELEDGIADGFQVKVRQDISLAQFNFPIEYLDAICSALALDIENSSLETQVVNKIMVYSKMHQLMVNMNSEDVDLYEYDEEPKGMCTYKVPHKFLSLIESISE